jgi:hypothetical protein
MAFVTQSSHLAALFLEINDDRSGSKSIMHPGRAASEGSGTSGADAVSVRDPSIHPRLKRGLVSPSRWLELTWPTRQLSVMP